MTTRDIRETFFLAWHAFPFGHTIMADLKCLSPTKMNLPDCDERPAKKRRFFVEASPEKENIPAPIANHTDVDSSSPAEEEKKEQKIYNALSGRANSDDGFDSQLLENFVGEKVPIEVISELRRLAGDNLEEGTFLVGQL